MPTAEAHIRTEHPSRYLVHLCKHAGKMGHKGPLVHLRGGQAKARPEVLHVENNSDTDTDGVLSLSWGQCTMRAGEDALVLRVEAADDEKLRRIQEILAADLERFGRRDDLTIAWRQSEATGS